jgi:gamma-glutamylaminecyclotransferase
MTHLFVYGTLKRGCKNHRHLASQTYVGEARTAPGYRLHDLGDYPGMVPDPADTVGVTGELWTVDAAALLHLDDFEGIHEGLYTRESVSLLAPFDSLRVHTYLYARDLAGKPALGPTWTEL